jgi:phosphate transport system permease protein
MAMEQPVVSSEAMAERPISARTSQHPIRSTRQPWSETAMALGTGACGMFAIVTTLILIAFLARAGIEGIREVGLLQLLVGRLWKPEANIFGGLPLIVGTLVSATGAVIVGALPAVVVALWIVEFAPNGVKTGYRRLMEVSAALPSVVFGWLALVHLVPITEKIAHTLYGDDAAVGGEGLASSAALLGLMIAPTVTLLSLDALSRVPSALRDASSALGASPLQTAFYVELPAAWRGLIIAVFFGFARAAGETMAVQMVIGNARKLPDNMFTPTTTISAQIVMDMQNAQPNTPASDTLFSMALVLLVISTSVVLITRAMSRRSAT